MDQIERRIEAIEAELAEVAPLVIERSRLLRARSLLLDVPPEDDLVSPNRVQARVTRQNVTAALATSPGARAGDLARALGTSQQVVSAHLYRGKGQWFHNRGGRWFVRGEADSD